MVQLISDHGGRFRLFFGHCIIFIRIKLSYVCRKMTLTGAKGMRKSDSRVSEKEDFA